MTITTGGLTTMYTEAALDAKTAIMSLRMYCGGSSALDELEERIEREIVNQPGYTPASLLVQRIIRQVNTDCLDFNPPGQTNKPEPVSGRRSAPP